MLSSWPVSSFVLSFLLSFFPHSAVLHSSLPSLLGRSAVGALAAKYASYSSYSRFSLPAFSSFINAPTASPFYLFSFSFSRIIGSLPFLSTFASVSVSIITVFFPFFINYRYLWCVCPQISTNVSRVLWKKKKSSKKTQKGTSCLTGHHKDTSMTELCANADSRSDARVPNVPKCAVGC